MAIRILVLSAIAAGLGLWTIGPEQTPPTDPIVAASVAPDIVDYTVSNIENGSACLITRGQILSARSRSMNAGKDCDAVWPGLSVARNWTQNEDGTVALTDKGGEAVLTIAMGDGVDYEALEPDNAILAFTALQ